MSIKEVQLHLPRFKGVFVGGTPAWKFQTAAEWVNLAHSSGKLCHIGRIGTVRSLAWAASIGADSVDRGSLTRNGTINYCRDYQEIANTSLALF